MSTCSVTAAGDLLLVNTANGVDESQKRLLAPERAQLHRFGQAHRQARVGRSFSRTTISSTANGRPRPSRCSAASPRRSSPAATAGSTASAPRPAPAASPRCSGSSTATPNVGLEGRRLGRPQQCDCHAGDLWRSRLCGHGADPEYGEGPGLSVVHRSHAPRRRQPGNRCRPRAANPCPAAAATGDRPCGRRNGRGRIPTRPPSGTMSASMPTATASSTSRKPCTARSAWPPSRTACW